MPANSILSMGMLGLKDEAEMVPTSEPPNIKK